MQLPDLAAFLAVAADHSFSAAARRLHRTQPAISQAVAPARGRARRAAVRPLVARRHADRGRAACCRTTRSGCSAWPKMPRRAVRELQHVRKGRVVDRRERGRGAQPAAALRAVLGGASRRRGRCPARDVAADSRRRFSIAALDFGVLTFQPADRGIQSYPARRRRHRPARRARTIRWPAAKAVTLEEIGRQVVIAHNDPSPARDRVLRAYERRADGDQHPDFAAEPRRHQARGRDGHRGGAAAPPLRADRDRARAPGGDRGARAGRDPPGAAGLRSEWENDRAPPKRSSSRPHSA